jgi:uncharacterized protein (TIGR01777 family)
MKVVIAGGTGVIGRALIANLTGNGYEIIVLSRNPDKHREALLEGVQIAYWDGLSNGVWANIVDGADTVINFAGENLAGEGFLPERWTSDKKKRLRQSRINSGRAIVEAIAAAKQKPKVLVQSSAIGYYGPRDDEPITESDPAGDDFLASIAVEWEACTEAVESFGVRRVIIRTGLIQTLEGGPLTRMYLPYKLFGGMYFGDGQQYWSWIHLDDEIRAIRFLLENDQARGPFNLTAPNPVTCRDFGKTLGKVMGRPSYMPVPGFALKLVIGEVATIVLDGQKVLPKKLEELGFSFQFAEVEKALQDIIR